MSWKKLWVRCNKSLLLYCLQIIKNEDVFCGRVWLKYIPGIKVLEKNNFKKVSTIKNMYKIKDKLYSDELTYCLKKINFNKKIKQH